MPTLRLMAIPLAVFLGASGCSSQGEAPSTPPSEDQKLERFFDEYLAFQFRVSPTTATALGVHDFDSEIDDLSPQAIDARLNGFATFLSRLPAEVDRAELSRKAQADFDILENDIQGNVFAMEKLKPYERDPLAYSGLISGSVYDLLKRDFAPIDARVKNAILRMQKLPRIVEQARSNLKAPPRPHVDVAIRQNRGAMAFYEAGIPDFVKGSALAGVAIAEGKKVAEALKQYQSWLENELQPRATGDWKLGRELWEEKLRYSLNASLTPAEIKARAKLEYDRVRAEMAQTARELWPFYFAGTPLPTGQNAVQETIRSVLAKIADEHSTRETIVQDARQVILDLRVFLRQKDLLTLPEPDRLNVIEMPEFQAGVSTAYLDPSPPLEPEGRSFYAIEPLPTSWRPEDVQSRLREYNKHMLKILSIHEGYPGHYVQLEYSNRFPSKIRRVLGNGPMVEGWAVYSELMMVESGFADSDPRLKLSRLKFYLRAVINALIDQGLHFGELDEEAALSLMVDGGFQEANEARSKLTRAQVTSTQLSTYFVGFQEVFALREEAKRAWGEAFTLKRFHEAFLSEGSPPVRVIREVMLEAK